MAVALNHTIVWVRDGARSAAWLAELLGLPPPTRFGPFHAIQLSNQLTLDFRTTSKPITSQHYAFLVSEPEFDAIFGRLRAREIPYWADPGHQEAGEINHHDGGRGVYWCDPDGHNLEIITRPYGSGA